MGENEFTKAQSLCLKKFPILGVFKIFKKWYILNF